LPVTSWPGVEAAPGRRGEFAFKVVRREIGHLHGDHAAHFFFPKETWVKLLEEGRIEHHPVFPDRQAPGPRRIESDADVRDVIMLMRLNYDAKLDLVRRNVGLAVLLAGAVGLALLALGIVYLTVECQALPGFLGPARGDTSPRTGLGIVSLVLGLAALIAAFLTARRRPPSAPLHS
jgi:hypothetical protein